QKLPPATYTWTVAFSPDSRYLAAGGESGMALWGLGVKAAEGKLGVTLRPVPLPAAPRASGWRPQHLVFSRGGERLAWVQSGVPSELGSLPDSLEVYVWKIGDPKSLFKMPRRASWGVEALAFSPDGQRLLFLNDKAVVEVRNVVGQKMDYSFRVGIAGRDAHLALSPDGTKLAITSPTG